VLITASTALLAAFLSTLASQPGDTLLSEVNKSARNVFRETINENINENISDSINNNNNNNVNNKIISNNYNNNSYNDDKKILKFNDSLLSSTSTTLMDNLVSKINKLQIETKTSQNNNNFDVNKNNNNNNNNISNNTIKQINNNDNKKVKNELKLNAIEIMIENAYELGFFGLFRGTKARIIQMSIIVVIQFLVYDFIKQLCGIAPTGL
jgi:hypothetical protein